MTTKASITTWTRLEPRPRGEDMGSSLEGRIYDPAWLLARQWQLGEFQGEDSAAPVQVAVTMQSVPLDSPSVSGAPIDCLAGAEHRPMTSDGRKVMSAIESAEAGAEFIVMLKEEGCSEELIQKLLAGFGLGKLSAGPEIDVLKRKPYRTEEQQFMDLLLAGRVLEGALLNPLLRQTKKTGKPALSLGISDAEAATFVKAAIQWVDWQDAMVQDCHDGIDRWLDERLEHKPFTIEGAGEDGATVSFTISGWHGDQLDWYDLDGKYIPMPLLPKTPTPIISLPAQLYYPGMPSVRYWQFEDAKVNWAQIDCNKYDLGRMLVTEFACSYANDWYLIPCSLSIGAYHKISSLVVTNTFNEQSESLGVVPHSLFGAQGVEWCLFRSVEPGYIEDPAERPLLDGLLLFPTIDLHTSEPQEEVHFFRDETANMAWAVEAKVAGGGGFTVDRYTESLRPPINDEKEETPTPKPDDALQYKLVSDIPKHWFPLVPKLPAPDQPPPSRYQRLKISEPPLGVILRPDEDILELWQEEIPREGCHVQRRYSLARGMDGKMFLWLNKLKRTGRGEGSSKLCFDSYDGV